MRSTLLWWCAVLMAFLWLGVPPVAAVDRTQVLPLSYGWNAVWMEVTPRNPDGSTVTADQVFATADSNLSMTDGSHFNPPASSNRPCGRSVWNTRCWLIVPATSAGTDSDGDFQRSVTPVQTIVKAQFPTDSNPAN